MSTLTRQPAGTHSSPLIAQNGSYDRPRVRSRWRLPVLGALVLAIAAILYLVTRPSSYHYRLDFIDAGQLVSGDLVRIGGTPAGVVDNIELTSNGQAQLDVSIDPSFGPLREGTTATIRSPGLTNVASRYVDVSPAPTFDPPLPANGVIPASRTTGIVDIDELFDALDASTRAGLRHVIRGFAQWYEGKAAQANLSAQYFPPALQAYSKLFSQIDADTPALEQFLTQTSAALGAIDQRSTQLTDLITQTRITAQALGSDNRSLSQALVNLPPALRSGSATFARLRATTLPALGRLVDATRPITRPLRPFLARFQPVLQESVPTFGRLRQIFDVPGANNDLYDALVELPALAREVTSDFPHAIKSLQESTPIFEFARPYIPDLVAWVANWAGIFAPYDANGHYARTVPVFGAFNFADDSKGGTLSQVPPDQRGTGAALQTGFLQRCPGAGIVPPSDHSAPFYDSGPMANPHCRSSESIGGKP